MHAYALPVYPRAALEQFLQAGELVLGLGVAAETVDGLLELGAAVLRAPVVLHIDGVALLRHHEFPHANAAEPAVLDHLRVRTSVNIDDEGIFLRRIEVDRLEEAVVVVEARVGGAHLAELHIGDFDVLQGILGGGEALDERAVAVAYVYAAGHADGAPGVDEPAAVRREADAVPATLRGEPFRLAYLRRGDALEPAELHPHQVVLHGGEFGAGIIDPYPVLAGCLANVCHVRGLVADALHVAEGVAEEEVLPPAAVVGAIDEEAVSHGPQRVLRLHPGLIVLGQDGAHERAVGGPVHVEVHMVLAAVEHLHEDVPGIGAPADSGEVALVGEVRDLKGR